MKARDDTSSPPGAIMLLALTGATPVAAQITKGVGPGGETAFVNTTCPDGYRQGGQVGAPVKG